MGAGVFVVAAVMPSVAVAATPKCFGQKATIVSSDSEILGTKKDDVIVSRSSEGSTIFGGRGNDLICGGPGFDFIYGMGGGDKLRGNGNSDALSGGGGNDLLLGDAKDGDSTDSANYLFSPNGITFNFKEGIARGEGTDRFENLDGYWGSDQGDVVVGSRRSEAIQGGAGDDQIGTGAGIDTVSAGDGDDVVDGGTGGLDLDILFLFSATGPTQVDLDNETATGPGLGNDRVTGFEAVFGSDFDDSIQGDEASNYLFGSLGNDDLNGGGGFDFAGYWLAAGPINASLQTNSATGEGDDTFAQIEGLLGTMQFDDTLTGDQADNYLDGYGGTDTFAAGGGNDWIVGGLGENEQVDGGPGSNDFWDYYGTDALNVNLVTGRIMSPSLGTLTIAGVESAAGADGDDTFVGDAANNTFYGWGGNDHFVGNAGDDRFDGGAGIDTADPGEGNDTCAFIEVLGGCEVDQGTTPIPPHQLSLAASAVESLRRNF